MPSTSVTVQNGKTPPSITTDSKLAKSERITGKVRTAVEAMVWQALPRAKAAEHAGISEHGLYKALRKPPVRAFYLAELDVLRTSERARNIHTLAEVRDQNGNQMARVAAVKALEQIGDDAGPNAGHSQTPGVVIQIIGNASIQPGPAVGEDHDTMIAEG